MSLHPDPVPTPPEEVLPQRTVVISAKIEPDLWGRWQALCKAAGINPSAKMRELIEEFVGKTAPTSKEGSNNV